MASNRIYKLTIAIPSYNRNLVLKENIQKLLFQINDQVEVVIIDNSSDLPIEETLNQELLDYPQLSVIRNISNIGLSANIIRGIEICKTKWVWLLSDDDTPYENAIEKILEQIESNENAYYINFTSNYSKNRSKSFQTTGENEFIEKVESIHCLFLISLGVYNVEAIRPYLRFSYLYSYTLVPHFVMLIISLKDNGKVVFSCDRIISNQGDNSNPNNKWSFLPLCLGLPTLIELPVSLNKKNIKKITDYTFNEIIRRPFMSLERILQLYRIEKLYILKYNFKQPYIRVINSMPFIWKFEYFVCCVILECKVFINLYIYSIKISRKILHKSQNLIHDNRFNRV